MARHVQHKAGGFYYNLQLARVTAASLFPDWQLRRSEAKKKIKLINFSMLMPFYNPLNKNFFLFDLNLQFGNHWQAKKNKR